METRLMDMLADVSNERKKRSEFFLIIRPHLTVAELMAECPRCGAIGSFCLELTGRLKWVSCSECSASMHLTLDDLRGFRSQLRDTLERIDPVNTLLPAGAARVGTR